jgi:alkylhydroperoxidase/carboxymuconolactone decarboxylase family protein YurZ
MSSTSESRPAPGQPWKKGGPSPNPTGLTKSHREFRRAFMERVPKALELLEGWMEGGEGVTEENQRFAVQTVLNRGLGKEGKASELPTLDAPPAHEGASDTQALLERTRSLMAVGLATLQAQQSAGDLGPEALERLGSVARSLGDMLVAEEKARQASKLSGLSTDELVDVVGKLLPREALERMLAAKQADEVKP